MKKDVVIFDLDGTLANIDARRAKATKDNGKMDWDIFFDPDNISLDLPNDPVIKMAQLLDSQRTVYFVSLMIEIKLLRCGEIMI